MASVGIGGYLKTNVQLVVEALNSHAFRVAIEGWGDDTDIKAETIVDIDEMHAIYYGIKSQSYLRLDGSNVMVGSDDRDILTIKVGGYDGAMVFFPEYSDRESVMGAIQTALNEGKEESI